MVDHLASRPMVKAVPDKEATTVANVISEELILEHGSPEIPLSDNEKEFTMTLWPMSARSLGLGNILLPLILPDQMARQRILISSSRPQ